MYILGISCFYHDSAACLLRDGKIVAAAHEERFTRKKHDSAFPHEAIQYCLKEGGIDISQIDYAAFYEKPIVKFDRILQTSIAYAPAGLRTFLLAMPLWLKDRLWMKKTIREELAGFSGPIIFPTHHESHAASAFYPSPFHRAAVLVLDAVGEWSATTYGAGNGSELTLQKTINFPHSLGMLYSAFTYYCGFRVNSGEYKLMGLAPYGKPHHANTIREHLISVRDDGSFSLNMDYFGYGSGLTMTNERFHALFGGSPRRPEEPLEQRHMDLAASIQEVTEEAVLSIARHIREETGEKNLCLAGGVALNCVANGRLFQERIFEDIWIQPAAGDAGGALGAALYVWHNYLKKPRAVDEHDSMQGAYLGPAFTDEEIEHALKEAGVSYEQLLEGELTKRAAQHIAEGKVVGWFQGRMEYGPRALGARSILGDARNTEMQSRMNLKIKFRESFRPFAPAVLAEEVGAYFAGAVKSPYMLLTFLVHPDHRKETGQEGAGLALLKQIRSDIPAVTHVDYSARVQTVSRDTNPRFHALLEAFRDATGCPVLINTSFNVRGEPIVCTPQDALNCFKNTGMDCLAIGNFLVRKRESEILDEETMKEWATKFEPD